MKKKLAGIALVITMAALIKLGSDGIVSSIIDPEPRGTIVAVAVDPEPRCGV